VLVAAGAGAGKTSTLVERCVGRLLGRAGADDRASLDEILMVTFTEAAAAEMRARVREELEEARAAVSVVEGGTPDSEGKASASMLAHIEEQLGLLDTAHICTLHSFCFKLVREHFHELEIDPKLIVLGDAEAAVLMEETLDEMFSAHYGDGGGLGASVQRVIQSCGGGHEQPIRDLILKLHEYTQTQVNPAGWIAGQLAIFDDPSAAQWRAWFLEALHAWRDEWVKELCAAPAENEPAKRAASALQALAAEATIDAFAAVVRELPDPGSKPKPKPEPFFEEAKFLRSLCPRPGSDPLGEDWEWVRGDMATLLKLAGDFSQRYSEAKREQGTVDFHDLEQFALRLLRESETGQPTALARQYQRQFRYVFVDECQDINAAQEAIVRAVSRAAEPGEKPKSETRNPATEGEHPRGNRFLVGDVKQSIYRFRLADPRIFQRYEAEWGRSGSGAQVIRLKENFRSREALLLFFNALFRDLMRAEVGRVQFTDDSRLEFGARPDRIGLSTETSPGPRVHIHLRLTEKKKTAEDMGDNGAETISELSSAECEARIAANCLLELRASRHQVWDAAQKCERDVDWGDMAVLLRAPAGKAETFAREFARQQIPVQVAQNSFFESIEVADLLNVLTILDNPLQDVPLIAVLHSPLAGLSPDELAEVRLATKDGPYWTALNRFHEIGGGSTASLKVGRFLERFGRWRRMGRDTSLSARLQTIISETGYLEWLAAGADNAQRAGQRLANVRRLLTLAERFDPLQRQGLVRFLRFVEAQQAVAGKEPLAATGNAVQILSIHRSKGLEYPVVVVPDLGKRFNMDDLKANVVLDARYGLCPKVKPPHTGQRYPSLTHWLSTRKERSELLGEELRLLYVALTRARDTLLLVGTASRSTAEKWAQRGTSARELLAASTMLGWLGPWVGRKAAEQNGGEAWCDTAQGQNDLFSWTIYNGEAVLEPRGAATGDHSASPTLPDAFESLCEQVSAAYPHAVATREAAKTSVSALRRGMREADEEARRWKPAEKRVGRTPSAGSARNSSPKDRVEPGQQLSLFDPAESASVGVALTPAQVGLAHHTFLELAHLGALGESSSLRREIERLEKAGVLSKDEAASLDSEALLEFWRGRIGRRISAQEASIWREHAFTARFGAAELRDLGLATGDAPPDEFVIVQGVVDVAVILPDEIWLLDFKTDDVAKDDVSGRATEYRPQIIAYAAALQRIYNRPVTERWLHFLSARQTVAI